MFMNYYLVADIGNTRTKATIFFNEKIFFESEKNPEELFSFLKKGNISIKKALICETGKDEIFLNLLNRHNIPYEYLSSSTCTPIHSKYSTAETLGTDRVAAICGAQALHPNANLLCITAGTCITYNLLTTEKIFMGGSISPGINMRLKAMAHFTAKLPLVDWDFEVLPALLANNTKDSLLSGAIHGTIKEIEGIIDEYQNTFNNLKIIITGGDASFLAANVKKDLILRPNLILEGLYTILRYNEKTT